MVHDDVVFEFSLHLLIRLVLFSRVMQVVTLYVKLQAYIFLGRISIRLHIVGKGLEKAIRLGCCIVARWLKNVINDFFGRSGATSWLAGC